jgi:hypothetical protein
MLLPNVQPLVCGENVDAVANDYDLGRASAGGAPQRRQVDELRICIIGESLDNDGRMEFASLDGPSPNLVYGKAASEDIVFDCVPRTLGVERDLESADQMATKWPANQVSLA